MQSSCVGTFYLPYQFPIKAYTSHFESIPAIIGICVGRATINRTINDDTLLCGTCTIIEQSMMIHCCVGRAQL